MADTAMLPASMATASKGMAGYVRPTLAQETYYRYYPAAATVRRMDEAVQRAEANPYVTRANALTAEVNRIRAEQEARIKRLNALQSAQLQAQAKMDQASLKAAGAAARGGRGVRFKDLVEAYKVYGEMGADEAKAYEARLKESNIGDRLNQLSTYGKMDAQSQTIQGVFGQLANQLENKQATGMSERQVMLALQGDAQGKSAFAALQNSEDMVARASAARALTKVLDARGVSDAGTFAANLLRVSPAMTTAEGEAKVVNDLAVQAQQLVEAGRGEAGTIPLAEQGLYNLIQQNLDGLMAPGGDRGAALAATKKQIAGRQLSPEEQAALDIYLQALRDDGLVTTEDMVGIAGEARRNISQAEIDAGKAAWEKARKNKSYRPQDAQWFDDEFLAQQRKLSAQTSAERIAREQAIGRAERTPEQIQQDMATEFVKGAIAAKGLEVYIPPEQVSSPFEAQALGGALHILRREGNDVMSLDANPEDRTRRLGGAGPLARTPVRVALKTFNQLPKTNGVISDADAQQGIAMLRKRFKRDPEKMMLAVQYFMAMDMNAQNQVDAPMGSGKTEPVEAPPVRTPPDTPPPVPEVPVRAQGAGTPDVGAFTEGGVSRGAPPRPVASPQQSVQGLGTDILSSVLGSQRRTDYGESIPPSADFRETAVSPPITTLSVTDVSPYEDFSEGDIYSQYGPRARPERVAGLPTRFVNPEQVEAQRQRDEQFAIYDKYGKRPDPATMMSVDEGLYNRLAMMGGAQQRPVEQSFAGFSEAEDVYIAPPKPRDFVAINAAGGTGLDVGLPIQYRDKYGPAANFFYQQDLALLTPEQQAELQRQRSAYKAPVADASYTGGTPMYGVNTGSQQVRKVENQLALDALR